MSNYSRWLASENARAQIQHDASVNSQYAMREQARERWQQRSAESAARGVAEEMVRYSAQSHPEFYADRDPNELVGLITGWLIGGGQ